MAFQSTTRPRTAFSKPQPFDHATTPAAVQRRRRVVDSPVKRSVSVAGTRDGRGGGGGEDDATPPRRRAVNQPKRRPAAAASPVKRSGEPASAQPASPAKPLSLVPAAPEDKRPADRRPTGRTVRASSGSDNADAAAEEEAADEDESEDVVEEDGGESAAAAAVSEKVAHVDVSAAAVAESIAQFDGVAEAGCEEEDGEADDDAAEPRRTYGTLRKRIDFLQHQRDLLQAAGDGMLRPSRLFQTMTVAVAERRRAEFEEWKRKHFKKRTLSNILSVSFAAVVEQAEGASSK